MLKPSRKVGKKTFSRFVQKSQRSDLFVFSGLSRSMAPFSFFRAPLHDTIYTYKGGFAAAG